MVTNKHRGKSTSKNNQVWKKKSVTQSKEKSSSEYEKCTSEHTQNDKPIFAEKEPSSPTEIAIENPFDVLANLEEGEIQEMSESHESGGLKQDKVRNSPPIIHSSKQQTVHNSSDKGDNIHSNYVHVSNKHTVSQINAINHQLDNRPSFEDIALQSPLDSVQIIQGVLDNQTLQFHASNPIEDTTSSSPDHHTPMTSPYTHLKPPHHIPLSTPDSIATESTCIGGSSNLTAYKHDSKKDDLDSGKKMQRSHILTHLTKDNKLQDLVNKRLTRASATKKYQL